MTTSTTYASSITAATAQSTAATTAAAAVTPTNTLASLTNNFNDFLSLLTTQLKNQDPTSPMDTNQFTSQLVQFTAVSQQIETNKTLGQLLTASQAQQLSQASALVGKSVSFTGGTLPLQNGAAAVNFQATGAQQVQVMVADSSGTIVRSDTVQAADGDNNWTWDGKNSSGKQLTDGAYTVSVTGTGTTVPFQAIGIVTGAEQTNGTVQLQFGNAAVTFDKVVSLAATSS
jgi:flagellar basal-body rod modification protein FlgD